MFLVFMRLFWSTEPQFLCKNKGFLYDNKWIKYSVKLYKIIWAKIADSRRLFTHCLRGHEKSTCEKLVSAWFLVWTSLGLNQGPPDYESVALTNWATSPKVRWDVFLVSHSRVVLPGFEPRLREPKTLVLPLHHSTILISVRWWGLLKKQALSRMRLQS